MGYVPRQYDSAKDFLPGIGSLGNISDADDKMRIQCYEFYDDCYHNRPQSFRVQCRGDSDIEIYLPSTKKIVDSTARYLAVDFDFQIKDGENPTGTDTLLRKIWKREEISKRHVRGKKSLLTRGDLIWHITADRNRVAGQRLSIQTIHPSTYFPIEDPNNSLRVIGCHIVDLVHDPRDKTNDRLKIVARRQTYLRENDGRISTQAGLFEVGAWDDRILTPKELKPVSILIPKQLLPQQITALPVYHIPNNEPDGGTWGMSQISGIEYIINALNQSMTYEDLSLVLQGLGVYVSSAGPPIDEMTGKARNYDLHPGNVVEIGQGDSFDRVTGVASVQPFQDHLNSLDQWALSGAGIPETATGNVDVSVAQSGIALALKMGPIIAENQDKQLAIGGKWDQIGYDLINGWLPAFEEIPSEGSEFTTTFGDPMPIDRASYVKELTSLYGDGLLLIDEVREKLEKLGYKYNSELTEKLLEEQQKKSYASTGDIYGGENGSDTMDLPNTLSSDGTNLRVVT